MKDEEYLFHSDCWEKKNIARSARNTRTHNEKSGRVRFHSDNLTNKELKAMSGEVKSYRLNEPMSWKEFKAMPDDIKVTYIKLLREKFDCFDSAIADMMGINKGTFSTEIKRLGLGHGTKHGGYRTWNEKEAFYAWAHGVPVAKEETAEQPAAPEEEQIPECQEEAPEKPEMVKAFFFKEEKNHAIPNHGNLIFEGKVDEILKTVGVLLGGASVHINITWDVVEGCDNG